MRVSVAILNVAVHERVEHVLRVLSVRPSPPIAEVLGVGDVSPFPNSVRRIPASVASRAEAVNIAVEAASAEFVLLLSADTIVPPATVEALAKALSEDPRCAVAGARLLRESGRLRPSRGRYPRLRRDLLLSASVWRRWCRLRARLRLRDESPSREVDWVPSVCAMVRRDAVIRVGPWPEGFRFDLADAVWCHRAQRQGWRVRFAPRHVAFHLAPFLWTDEHPRDVLLAYEHSWNQLLDAVKSPVAALLHRWVRRGRLGMKWLGYATMAWLLRRRDMPSESHAREAAQVLHWYHRGRPDAPLRPTAENEVYWYDLW